MKKTLFALLVLMATTVAMGCGGAESNEPSREEVVADSIAQEVETLAEELESETESLKSETESTADEVSKMLEDI